MKTVAIVCEYNPFHLGHARQLEMIRRDFGRDTTIIAVMSGNYVQRGELAVMHKFDRAEAAVRAGVSLVLELPFPFSAAGAEFFAESAVSLIHSLGTVDILSFGSECGDLALLSKVAERISSPDFEYALRETLQERKNKSLGFAALRQAVYTRLFGDEGASCLASPNDTLALYYLRALSRLASPISPHAVRRVGTDKDAFGDTPMIAGATHIRCLMKEGSLETALSHVPSTSHPLWERAVNQKEAPVFTDGLENALLSHLRLSRDASAFAECGGGLYSHISEAARHADSFASLLSAAATKKYTDSRIRRAILFSYFGVTPAELREKPLYTQVLALDAVGRQALAHMRKTASLSIMTKPADTEKLPSAAVKQAQRAYRADSVYSLAMPRPREADLFIRRSPFVLTEK